MNGIGKVGRTTLWLAGVAAVIGLATGCSSGSDSVLGNGGAPAQQSAAVAEGGSAAPQEPLDSGAALPTDWPAALPVPASASLSIATIDPDGAVYAVWTTAQPAEEILAAYGPVLEAGGFTTSGSSTIEGGVSADYAGNGYVVNVTAVTDAGVTALTLTGVPEAQ